MKAESIKTVLASPCTFITITTETCPSKLKAGLGLVKKSTHKSVTVGTSIDYERIMNKRQEKMGLDQTEVQARTWGEKVDGLIVTHKEKEYLTVIFTEATKSTSEYYLNGEKKEKCEIEHLLPKKNDNCLGFEYRNFKCESVTSITVNGHTYSE